MEKEKYMPYPTFSLDNQLKIHGEKIAEIAKSFKKPDQSQAGGAGEDADGQEGAYIFVAIMDFGIDHLWPEPLDPAFLSVSWEIAIIMTVGGFLVYLLYRFKNAKEINPFVSMVRGGMDTRHVFVTALVGFMIVQGFGLIKREPEKKNEDESTND